MPLQILALVETMKEVEGKLLATNKELDKYKVLAKKMKEVEGKLLATNKELDEYKALAKKNDKRFKDYQNDHFPKCQCSTKMKELEITLRKKDYELNECKKAVNKNEEMVAQNQIRINDCESKLASRVVQIKTLRNKAEVIQDELKLYDWRIDWNELNDYGILESAPFYTTSDLYCLSLSMECDQADIFEEKTKIYLHRCRDYGKADEQEGRIQTLEGFYYKIYVVFDNEIVCTNSGYFTDYSLFNIGWAYQRSKGFLCLEFDYDYVDVIFAEDFFHVFCTASTF